MRKTITIIILCLILLVTSIYAAQPVVQQTQEITKGMVINFPANPFFRANNNITIYIHVYNSTGHIQTFDKGTTCAFHLYNSTGEYIVEDNNMSSTGTDYYYVLNSSIKQGDYPFLIFCNNTVEGGFASYIITIADEGNTTFEPGFPIAVIIILPLILCLIFLVGSATLGKEHTALKIFLFITSILPFFTSLHFGMLTLIRFYHFETLENAIGTTTYWSTLLFVVIFVYFLIYFIYKAFQYVGKRKKERLEY